MNDHRIAMAMAVLGTKRGGISIVNPMCVSKSYPTFWKDLRKVFEDQDLFGRIEAGKIFHLPIPLYNYVKHGESVTDRAAHLVR